jgi:glucose/arabinose dehydrogenase
LEGMPNENGRNRVMAFDAGGNMFVALSGTGNNVCAIGGSRGTVGMQPCPELKDRAGIWRWSADRPGQKAAEGELIATGNRNMTAFEYSPRHNALFGIFHERDFTGELWPQFVTPAQELAIGESLYRIGKGTDFGWPYSYWDGVRNIRLVAPEYGGDGKTITPAGKYTSPILSFPSEKGRGAPVSMVFYDATQFPAQWRGGLFLTRHGGIGDPRPGGYAGYDILFVPMDAQGRPGKPVTFADGFAGPSDDDRATARAAHRPNGLAIGPDGALFVVDSKGGRLWRIAYTGN